MRFIPLNNFRFPLTCFALAAMLAGCTPPDGNSSAANYPRKAVTLICPWAPGGGTDRVSRYFAQALQQEFGKPFIVQNRTGGSGNVGHTAGASAMPDGYTITMITAELSTMHRMGVSKLTYEDYDCLLQMNADAAAIMVNQDAPWPDLQSFLDEAKKEPGKLQMSGTATGGAWDLARAGMLYTAGIPVDAITWVPTKGAAPSLLQLLAKEIDAVCCSVPEAASQIESGQLRVLAVMSDERLPDYPDIPTVKESGVDWVSVGWRGLALPKGSSPDVRQALEEKCLAIARSDDFKQFMQKNGFGVTVRDSKEFTEFLAAQDAQWKPVVEAAGYAQ